MPSASDARKQARFEEEALKRLLWPHLLTGDGLVRTHAGMIFATPASLDRVLGRAFSDPVDRQQIVTDWRRLAGRLGLQTVLFEQGGTVNRWLGPSLDRVRTWFRSSKGSARARARREALSGAVGAYLYEALEALMAHAQNVNWTKEFVEIASWRAFVYADEREVAYWFHRLKSLTAATHLDRAIIALGDANLRKVPASLRTPEVLRACLASARSSMSLDIGDEDQRTIIERLLIELAKFHPPVIDAPETRVHLVKIVSELVRAERFLVEELRWNVLQSKNESLVDLFRVVAIEEVRESLVDEAA